MKQFVFIVALVVSSLSIAQPVNWFEQANKLYQEQNFAEAQALYDSIVASGYQHPETYYNLGNVHYRQGHVGLAILNYEKALKLNPSDQDAQHNLELAKKQTVDEFNVVPTPPLRRVFNDVAAILSSGSWTILALAAFLLALVSALLFLFKSRSSLVLTAFIVGLILGLLFEGFAYGTHILEEEEFAVVTAANTYVKSAPADSSTDLYILHEGTKVKVLETFEGWQKVKLPDGKLGWVVVPDLETI
jgi:tetratricopeptide (TPR) repeat protein